MTLSNGVNEIEPLKRVLMISAYSPGFMTFSDQVEGIKEAFSGHNIQLEIEFMDTKRFLDAENIENFHQSLMYKLEHYPTYDLVIAADDNALDYVNSQYEVLFDEIPVVFMGINSMDKALVVGENPLFTGVTEKVSFVETIELAIALNPDAKRVVAITDPTPTGQNDLEAFEHASESFQNLESEVIDLSTMDYETFKKELQLLDHEDIVLLISLYSNQDDNRIVFLEGIDMLLSNCSQPIFHIYEHGIGDGLIGGMVVSHFEQGKTAGALALRVLEGESISQIPVLKESPNIIVFDSDVLKSYDMDRGILPVHTKFVNEVKSPFMKYWPYILVALILIGFEMAIILKLRTSNKRNRMIEGKLQLSNTELERSNKQFFRSNQQLKEKEQRIRNLIYQDSLTGLKNRYAMTQELDQLLQNASSVEKIYVMFLDIDNFKNINDTYGHDVGDQVIRLNGQKLIKLLSDHVSIGRFGGDEFIIIMKEKNRQNTSKKLIQQIIETFKMPVKVGEILFDLTVSIGSARYPDHGLDSQDLIKKADLALYRAKEIGKDTAVNYNPQMSDDFQSKISFQKKIREAMDNQDFHLNYQPVIDIRTGEIHSVEALIRWQDTNGTMVSPIRLINHAEEMGVIDQIGYWVFDETSRFIKKVERICKINVHVAVNVSPLQLMKEKFFDNVMVIVNHYGVNPKWISLEVTETAIISSLEKSIKVLNLFRAQGFTISLDDFGTGYSSLKYFNQLPIDTLKIDKSFIDDLLVSEYDQDMVNTIIKLAHTRGSDVIAEGVEKEDQLKALYSNQCDLIQGYLFSKPLNENDIIKLFIKRSRRAGL
jgi:diguanylate cyclase (GGDEF)-like protein